MKMFKKTLLFLLPVLFLVFSTGCGNNLALPEEKDETIPTAEKDQRDHPQREKMTVVDENNSNEAGQNSSPGEKGETPEEGNMEQASPSEQKGEEKPSDSSSASKEDGTSEKTTKAEPKQYVTVTVTGLSGQILPPSQVEIGQGDTVIGVTIKVLKKNNIQYSVTGSGVTAYVEGINNVYEMDEGPLSGWLFKKNGKIISRGSGAEPVTNGDTIEWFYTKDYTNTK